MQMLKNLFIRMFVGGSSINPMEQFGGGEISYTTSKFPELVVY